MTFVRILLRGFSAANRSLAGLVLLIVFYGTYEGVGIVFSDLAGILLEPLAEEPPPDEVVTMGHGCCACVWLIATAVGGPWIKGGIIGQMQDRMSAPALPPGNFGMQAEMHYMPMLVLSLAFWLINIVLQVPVALLGMGISELPSHPGLAELLPKAINALIGQGLGLIFMLAAAVVVTEYEEPFAALKITFSFLTRHIADVAMLFVVVGALNLTSWLPRQGLLLLFRWHLPTVAVLGAVTAVYEPYVMLLSMAWAVSLWLARRPGAIEIVDLTEVELPQAADGAREI
jgi:hypothetical protein